jgi:uncharacterized membrane protein HdeD (DUF308 family)/alpha-beta hydrolase superfamily lysophospholipase
MGTATTEAAQAPRVSWGQVVLGLLLVVVGGILTVTPFVSIAVLVVLVVLALSVTGAGELATASRSDAPMLSRVMGVAWLAAALVVVLWPGPSIRVLAVTVGLVMVASGVLRMVTGVRGTSDARLASILLGAAGVVLGLLALAWPDVTVFVVAVAFGVRTVIFGLSLAWSAVRAGWHRSEGPAQRPGVLRRWGRTLGAVVALLGALALLLLSVVLRGGAPEADAFYDPPAQVPADAGSLLAAETFERDVPEGARAWRILYTTTRDEGQPAVASAVVVAPAQAADEPHDVVAWAHGTTGVVPGCAPSVLEDPFEAGATPALPEVVDKGWVMVATDYVGLGTEGPHPYLIGQGEGRSVLDAVRAARQLEDVDLAERTVVWGHSQGGHAALWAGVLAADYAPDAEVVGVAAMAPASNLPGLVDNLDVVPGGSLFASYIAQAYSEVYDDVAFDDVIRPAARVQAQEIAGRCLAEPGVLVSLVETFLFGGSVFAEDATSGTFGARLAENVPSGAIDAPLLLAQGAADPLVLPAAQDAYVQQRCADGHAVDYRTYPGEDHLSVVADDSALIGDLLQWTQDRFDGVQSASTCPG